MSKDSFVFHHDYIDFDEFSAEEVKELVCAMIAYSANDAEPTFDDRVLRIAWKGIKSRMDADKQAYADRCEQNRENIRKRWSKSEDTDTTVYDRIQSNTNEYEPIRTDTKNTDIDIDIEFDSENRKRESTKEKAPRRKHGEYAHVILTDAELIRLYNDFGQEKTEKAIQILDEYIQQTGKKYKDHNLTLRKWCFKAVDEQEKKPPSTRSVPDPILAGKTKTGFSNFDERSYDFKALERQLAGAS